MIRLLVGGPRDTMCCVISIVASSGIFHVLRDVRDIEKKTLLPSVDLSMLFRNISRRVILKYF